MLVRLAMPPLVSLAMLTLLHSLFQGQTHLWHEASQTAPAAKCLMPNRLRQVGIPTHSICCPRHAHPAARHSTAQGKGTSCVASYAQKPESAIGVAMSTDRSCWCQCADHAAAELAACCMAAPWRSSDGDHSGRPASECLPLRRPLSMGNRSSVLLYHAVLDAAAEHSPTHSEGT